MSIRFDSNQPVAGDIVLRKGKRYLVNASADGMLFVHKILSNGVSKTYGKPQRLWKDGCYRILRKQAKPESAAFAEAQAAGLLPDMDALAREMN